MHKSDSSIAAQLKPALKSALLAIALLFTSAPAISADAEDPSTLVNTFIGTQDEGNTFPGVHRRRSA